MEFPCFLFHKELAAEGRLIRSEEDLPKGDGWVNTPAKFDPDYQEPAPVAGDDAPAESKRAGYTRVSYPSHRYKRGDADNPRLVQTEEEDRALHAKEPGVWGHSPDPDHHGWKGDGSVAQTEPADVAPTVTAPTAAQRDEFYAASVKDVVDKITAIGDVAMLLSLAAIEDQNPKGARPTVLKAIKARKLELSVPA